MATARRGTRWSGCGRTPSPAPEGCPKAPCACGSMTSGPFVEMLRHLVVATGAWVGRAIPGEPVPYCRLGLLHPAYPPADATAVGIDVDACPSLAAVLEVRENPHGARARHPGRLTGAGLELVCARLPAPG